MSLTLKGLLVLVIGRVLEVGGVAIANDQVTDFVAVLLQVFGALGVYIGRVRMGNVTWYGKRK